MSRRTVNLLGPLKRGYPACEEPSNAAAFGRCVELCVSKLTRPLQSRLPTLRGSNQYSDLRPLRWIVSLMLVAPIVTRNGKDDNSIQMQRPLKPLKARICTHPSRPTDPKLTRPVESPLPTLRETIQCSGLRPLRWTV